MKIGFCGKLFDFSSTEELYGLAVASGFEKISLSILQVMDKEWENTEREKVDEICWRPEDGISIDIAAEAAVKNGAHTLVIPAQYAMKYQDQLLKIVKNNNLKIAFENGYGGENPTPFEMNLYPVFGSTADDLITLCSEWNNFVGKQSFCVCLNTGHAILCGQDCGKMAREIDGLLGSVHANDNFVRNDYHMPPFRGRDSIDWEDFLAALGEIDYKESLFIDVHGLLSKQTPKIAEYSMKVLYLLGCHMKDVAYKYREQNEER